MQGLLQDILSKGGGGVINFSVSIITACVTMPINTLLRVLCHQFTLAKLAVFTLHAYARGGGGKVIGCVIVISKKLPLSDSN